MANIKEIEDGAQSCLLMKVVFAPRRVHKGQGLSLKKGIVIFALNSLKPGARIRSIAPTGKMDLVHALKRLMRLELGKGV